MLKQFFFVCLHVTTFCFYYNNSTLYIYIFRLYMAVIDNLVSLYQLSQET